MEIIKNSIDIAAGLFTIVASGIAIYLFVFKRDKIANAIDVLLNYSNRITLSELTYKLERLNDYNANDEAHKLIILNILNDISGQINGNKKLKVEFLEITAKILEYTEKPKSLTEPRKRSLVSEVRESLRHIDVNNYKKMV